MLDPVFDQFDAIFETAGDQALSREQEKQLDALDQKVANIFANSEV